MTIDYLWEIGSVVGAPSGANCKSTTGVFAAKAAATKRLCTTTTPGTATPVPAPCGSTSAALAVVDGHSNQ